jgi:glycosyltransferase involved in cell wall biosynthesis
MDSPTISVVMSVFNGEPFLREAVESILAQTFRDFELIIIDDGSTDTTPQILVDYAKRDSRVRVFRQENVGRAESLNRGLTLARSSLVARIDADDIALSERFQRQLDFLSSHPEVGLLGAAYVRIRADGRTIDTEKPPLDDAQIRQHMARYNPICHSTVMMRKELALAVGGYRKLLLDTDDYDLWLRMSERTKIANLEEPVVRYRIHARQVSVGNSNHQTWCVIAARTAAVYRARGEPDPLSQAREITPQFLNQLGVTASEIQCDLISVYEYWTRTFSDYDPELTAAFAAELTRLLTPRALPRAALADTWLWLAGIHFRQGRIGRALLAALRGLFTRPIVAGRPAKRAFLRLNACFRS